MKLYLVTPHEILPVERTGLFSVGGKKSSGKILKSLQKSGDYAVISFSDEGISIHVLGSKNKTAITLMPGQSFQIDDLILSAVAETESRGQPHLTNSWSDFLDCLRSFSQVHGLTEAMDIALNKLITSTGMQKGLFVVRNSLGKFELMVQKGMDPNEPWMSQSLILETIKTQNPLSIQNIYGSHFETNKSLMATGFISIYTWPLVVRGETLGVAVVGSLRPHSGLTLEEKQVAESLAQLAALIIWFHLRDTKLKEEVAALKEIQRASSDSPLTTTYTPLLETLEMAHKIAPTFLNILIHGETGVGKEVLARWIHQKSDRGKGPFIAVNCGAIPAELLESILFGHKKGSFTGAHADQMGKFQAAHGGTLFLDEIGDLPFALQVKILRAIQEQVIEPLGSNMPIKIDIRILSASHRDLPNLVKQKKFREDLYFRLAEVVLEIPPLRQRPEDISLLVLSFLKDLAPEKRLSTKAWSWVKTQSWNGNVRELLSAIKRAVAFSQSSEIEAKDFTKGLPSLNGASEPDWLGGKNLEEAKEQFIQEKVKLALQRSEGQKNKAAELLGITPRTLFRYLEGREEGDVTELSH